MACCLPLSMACGMIAATEIEVARNAARSQGGFNEPRMFRCIRIGAGACRHCGCGAKQASIKTRRHPRYVRSLRRHYRAGQRDGGEDGSGGFRRRSAGPQDRDHRGRSSQQGRPSRQYRPRHVRQSGRRDAVRRGGIGHRAGRARDLEGARQDQYVQRSRIDPPLQRGLRPLHCALRVRYIRAGQCLAAVKQGLDSWFFLTADYAFGQDLEKDTTNVALKSGGKILGGVRHPLNTSDFSSYLLQAQSSKAKVIGLANAGGDTINAIKQAAEFGLMKSGQKLSPLLAFITDIDSVGLETAQGLLLAEAYYWDLNDETRAFSKRFMARTKRVPSAVQAGTYSSVTHYLKAVKAAGTTDAAAVMKIMKETPINDMFARNGRIREDGRMVHDMYLFEVKKPSESKGRWDDYRLLATIPGNEAFQSLELSRCPLVKK